MTEPSGTAPTRLLVVACAQRKHQVRGKVPAWQLYDGQAYRVMKKLETDGRWPADVAVWILSAKYGLVPRAHLVEPYDQKMTRARAEELRTAVGHQLRELVATFAAPAELCVFGGKEYRHALKLEGLRTHPCIARILIPAGGLGEQVSQLRAWLVGAPQPLSVRR